MTRLFHAVAPFPECCGFQMSLQGNESLHALIYQCPTCLRTLRVTVAFEEDYRRPVPPPETLAATDATP
jgi:hypothetical protein